MRPVLRLRSRVSRWLLAFADAVGQTARRLAPPPGAAGSASSMPTDPPRPRTAAGTPPDHWLAVVRARAPRLLTGGGIGLRRPPGAVAVPATASWPGHEQAPGPSVEASSAPSPAPPRADAWSSNPPPRIGTELRYPEERLRVRARGQRYDDSEPPLRDRQAPRGERARYPQEPASDRPVPRPRWDDFDVTRWPELPDTDELWLPPPAAYVDSLAADLIRRLDDEQRGL